MRRLPDGAGGHLFLQTEAPRKDAIAVAAQSQSWSNNNCICITLRLVMRWPTLTDPTGHILLVSIRNVDLTDLCSMHVLHAKYFIMTMSKLHDLLRRSLEWGSHPTPKCRIPVPIYSCSLHTPTLTQPVLVITPGKEEWGMHSWTWSQDKIAYWKVLSSYLIALFWHLCNFLKLNWNC